VKSRTVIVSLLLHVVVFGLALQISASRAARKATTVAVVGEKKKKEEKKEDKPKPKPRPQIASTKPIAPTPAAVAPKIAPTHAPTPEAAAPAETNIEMGNDVGLDVGGPPAPKKEQQQQQQQQQQQTQKKAAPVKKEKVLAPEDNPETDNCTEAPSKPVPTQRPSDIEYTQEARANNVEGRLVLKIFVGADGSVIKVDVVSSVDPQLDAAAIAAVKTWVFTPSMRCGKAMAGGVFTLARRFELGD
jgi:protein TonB